MFHKYTLICNLALVSFVIRGINWLMEKQSVPVRRLTPKVPWGLEKDSDEDGVKIVSADWFSDNFVCSDSSFLLRKRPYEAVYANTDRRDGAEIEGA